MIAALLLLILLLRVGSCTPIDADPEIARAPRGLQASMSKLLFGERAGWHAADWTASDDRSYLSCSKAEARFYGILDIKTLGGAGFASQRTTAQDTVWDLSSYGGIELVLDHADQKMYTFILKDELLPPNPQDGREQSTVSYEYDFCVPHTATSSDKANIFIAWKDLRATYRGRKMEDAPPLNTKQIKRMSFMMRSFFGTQEGDFSLTIHSIAAVVSATPVSKAIDGSFDPGLLSWLFGKIWKL